MKRTIFEQHYQSLRNIFDLYAAADGSPYELGRDGAMQLCSDLRLDEPWGRVDGADDGAEDGAEDDGAEDGAEDDGADDHFLPVPQAVRQAETSRASLIRIYEKVKRDAGVASADGLHRHHFFVFLMLIAEERYGGRRALGTSPSVSLRYLLTWEVCRGQIDYSPHQFRLEVLYSPDVIRTLMSSLPELISVLGKRVAGV